jgi:hypothetical protein
MPDVIPESGHRHCSLPTILEQRPKLQPRTLGREPLPVNLVKLQVKPIHPANKLPARPKAQIDAHTNSSSPREHCQ